MTRDRRALRVKGAVYLAGVLARLLALVVASAMRMGGPRSGWVRVFNRRLSCFLCAVPGPRSNMSAVHVGSACGAGMILRAVQGLRDFLTGVLRHSSRRRAPPLHGSCVGYAFSQPARIYSPCCSRWASASRGRCAAECHACAGPLAAQALRVDLYVQAALAFRFMRR